MCKQHEADMDNGLCAECHAQQNGIQQCAKCGRFAKKFVVVMPGMGYCLECAPRIIDQQERTIESQKEVIARLDTEGENNVDADQGRDVRFRTSPAQSQGQV